MNIHTKKQNRLQQLLDTSATAKNLDEIVSCEFFPGSEAYPLVIKPKDNNVSLKSWIENNRERIDKELLKYGAILFRDFAIQSMSQFESISGCFGERTAYVNRSSPRTEIENRIYTSTEYPADQKINMHTELSYASAWPLKIMFCCDIPAEEGGETPIAGTRAVLGLLKDTTKETFREKGILYKRNFSNQFGLPWQEVFQTEDIRVVEEECRRTGMKFRWYDNYNKLNVEWVRPALVKHPHTHEDVWFNHGFFFHISTLGREVTDNLNIEDIPFSTFYGDGTEIPEEIIDEIRAAYDRTIVMFTWNKGDILLIDNMLMAHGRNSYRGKRRILVAMTDQYSI